MSAGRKIRQPRTVVGIVALGIIAACPFPAAAQSAGAPASDTSDDLYCIKRKLGYWFYCAKPVAPEQGQVPEAQPSATAAETLDKITGTLRELKARAILEPMNENVTAYVRFQREQLDRSSMFADVWQRALWQDPGLDYTLQRPVSTLGKRAWIDQRKSDRDRVMGALSQRYGVFYFFSSSCGACGT